MPRVIPNAPISRISDTEIIAAFPGDDIAPHRAARLTLLRQLHEYYAAYLGGPETFLSIPHLNADPQLTALENSWLRWEDAQINPAWLPASAADFHDWFADLAAHHVQPEFCRYVANEATLAEIGLFFMAEELVDSRFDDLVAMMQIGTAGLTKLTIAENYWDEMGEGKLEQMHTRLFEQSARYMRRELTLRGVNISEIQCAEIYENACLVLMYGIYRHLAPRALGAMGLMEHSAPSRFQAMVAGCTRLGVPDEVVDYQRIHIHVDTDHGAQWLEKVLVPVARRSPELLREISLGVLTRRRVADAYYQHMWEQMRKLR